MFCDAAANKRRRQQQQQQQQQQVYRNQYITKVSLLCFPLLCGWAREVRVRGKMQR
jgi:hypothetical protein